MSYVNVFVILIILSHFILSFIMFLNSFQILIYVNFNLSYQLINHSLSLCIILNVHLILLFFQEQIFIFIPENVKIMFLNNANILTNVEYFLFVILNISIIDLKFYLAIQELINFIDLMIPILVIFLIILILIFFYFYYLFINYF